ncbi:ABC transporter permease [Haloarcula litorea]|uniref:ABC transporter permease n=1 Tax=Haloarcula litorea TaxID=3032579 RepID=UPI0023E8790A|nr:ABC transporter permease [Halomicroarcula sp. GDY20]
MSATTEDQSAESESPDWFPFAVSEAHLLTGPTVLWFAVFLGVPLVVVFVYSFLTYESYSVVMEFTLSNWLGSAFSGTVASVFIRTLTIGIVVTVTCLLAGYPVAYFLRFYTSENGGILLLLFLVIPFWTSALIRTLAWFPILGRTGFVNFLLVASGITSEPVSWLLFSPFSQLVAYLQNYVVFMTAPIYISLSQIDEDLLGASETLRGGPLATFRNVVWPLSKPGVAIGSIFVFVLSIGNFLIPQFLSGGQATVTTLIYLRINNGLNYPVASALSILLLVVIFIPVMVLLKRVDIADIAR